MSGGVLNVVVMSGYEAEWCLLCGECVGRWC